MKVALGAGWPRQPRKNWGTSKKHFLLENGGGMGYTHFSLARKGEMTDYPRG